METLGNITLYNADCMDLLRQMPDKAFEVAIVDCPYGIGESGARSHTRIHLARAKDYKPFAGNDTIPPPMSIFLNYGELAKIRLYGARTTLLAVCRMIVRVGSYGIKKMEEATLPIASWHGLHLSPPFGFFDSVGRVCYKAI